MPTLLTKPVRRVVLGGTHVVELHADGVRLREKRRRTGVVIPWAHLLAYTPEPSLDVETRHYQLRAALAPEGVIYLEHGTKRPYTLPHGVAFQRAVVLAVAQDKAEKKATRSTRRRARASRL